MGEYNYLEDVRKSQEEDMRRWKKIIAFSLWWSYIHRKPEPDPNAPPKRIVPKEDRPDALGLIIFTLFLIALAGALYFFNAKPLSIIIFGH